MDTQEPTTPAQTATQPTPPPLLPNPAPKSAMSERNALVLKLLAIAAFALVLLLPLALVRNTLSERQSRYYEAVSSITAPWGGDQRIIGPILVVPYTYKVETEEWVTGTSLIGSATRIKEKKIHTHTSEAYFLPTQFNIDGTLAPDERKRSIYTAHVYTATLRVSGKFDKPSLAWINQNDVQPQWHRARLCFTISDLRGVRESLALAMSGQNVPMQPGDGYSNNPGLHADLPAQLAEAGGEFTLNLTLNGSDTFMIAPLAQSTKMHLTSKWPDPSFCGDYLPVKRDISTAGFDALWETSYYARTIPQQWTADTSSNNISLSTLSEGSFGVRMLPAISAYRIVERSIKYGVLFIALAFTVFFLFEVVARIRLNALNYLLVGATLCVFFLGLLALSEFMSFTLAYAIAAALAILMIGLYSARILQNRTRALAVSAMLGGVYAYLYFILRMEDFALIAGTAALFAVLAALMYATRNLHNTVKS